MTPEQRRRHIAKTARITEAQVRLIRRGLDAGMPASHFSRLYRISGEQVRKIGRREAWAWVPEADEGLVTEQETYIGQPTPAEVKASQERLVALLKEAGLEVKDEDNHKS